MWQHAGNLHGMRSAGWQGDLMGLGWRCNRFTAASALCGHKPLTPV